MNRLKPNATTAPLDPARIKSVRPGDAVADGHAAVALLAPFPAQPLHPVSKAGGIGRALRIHAAAPAH